MFEEQKKEAVKRMHKLQLDESCIKTFETSNEVWISENNGMLYNLSKQPEIKDKIKKFEEDNNGLVYHAVKDTTEFGTLITLFYVCEDRDEWEFDSDDMKDNYSFCYIINLDDDYSSGFDSIQYKTLNGGIVLI